jgi:hypothetical protein
MGRRDSLRPAGSMQACKYNITNYLKALTSLQNWPSDCNIGHGQAKVCMDVFERMV